MNKKSLSITMLLLLTVAFCPPFIHSEIPAEDLIWKFGSSGSFDVLPAAEGSVVYCGNSEGFFYAINTDSGKELWHYKVKYPVTSTAAVKGNLVCFEAGNTLYGLNRLTGEALWSYAAEDREPGPPLGPTDYHHSSPLIVGETAYFGDEWGHMNGVNIRNGKSVFQYTTENRLAIRSKPAVREQNIYFGDWEGNIYSVSIPGKSEKWQYKMANARDYYGAVVSEMIIKDNLLYFGSQHDTYSPIHIGTGIPKWTFVDTFKTYLPSTPVFYKNDVIAGSTILAFKIYRLREGNVIWAVDTKGIFFTKPIIIDSVLIINSSDFGNTGYLYFVDCESGKILNEISLEQATPSSPVIVGEKLIIGRKDGLYAIRFKPYVKGKE